MVICFQERRPKAKRANLNDGNRWTNMEAREQVSFVLGPGHLVPTRGWSAVVDFGGLTQRFC
jgi:hypothetical protein